VKAALWAAAAGWVFDYVLLLFIFFIGSNILSIYAMPIYEYYIMYLEDHPLGEKEDWGVAFLTRVCTTVSHSDFSWFTLTSPGHSDSTNSYWFNIVSNCFTLFHADSYWFTLIHIGSHWFTLNHTDSNWFTLIHAFTLAHTDSHWLKLNHSDSHSARPTAPEGPETRNMIHADSHGLTLIHTDSRWFTLNHTHSDWLTLSHSDSHWFTMIRTQRDQWRRGDQRVETQRKHTKTNRNYTDSHWFILNHTDSNWFTLIPAHSHWIILITHWITLIHNDSYWFTMIRTQRDQREDQRAETRRNHTKTHRNHTDSHRLTPKPTETTRTHTDSHSHWLTLTHTEFVQFEMQ
jgi:hypothetical protein